MLPIAIVSDLHYAGPGEQARRGYETRGVAHPLPRSLVWAWRHFVWLRDPLAHNHRLHLFVDRARDAAVVIANGDYSCDSAFIGVSDEAARQSAAECLGHLRSAFQDRLELVIGDHELGKRSMLGGQGGLRFRSLEAATGDLGLARFWTRRVGRCVLMGVTSTLVALPVFAPEILPGETTRWASAREDHLAEITRALEALEDSDRLILFCHDPTALPFLAELPAMQPRMGQIDQTIIGHLHSPLILWQGRQLAGIRPVTWLGNTVRRYTTALTQARCWETFRVRLCPSPAGIQLLKDGGYLRGFIDPAGRHSPRFWRERLPW